MKTAMTQFLEWLENSSDVKNDILNWETVKDNALEKEKEQIMDDFNNGMWSTKNGLETNGQEYYTHTYNQNK